MISSTKGRDGTLRCLTVVAWTVWFLPLAPGDLGWCKARNPKSRKRGTPSLVRPRRNWETIEKTKAIVGDSDTRS